MGQPLVSIVIPAYNQETLVANAIDSALAQTYTKIEVIVVDDGSTDASSSVVESVSERDQRVVLIRQANGGVTSARYKGIEQSQGEWICFMDSDDTLPEDAIEKFSAYFEDGSEIIASGEPKLTLEHYKCGLMRRKCHPELWGKLFRADFIKEHHPILDRSVIVGEDQIINLVLANQAQKLATIPELLYRYNLGNPGSVMKHFRHTADYEIKFQRLFNSLIQPGFREYNDAIRYAEYKMKIEGFKMIVLDGNRFDPNCDEWKAIANYYKAHPEEAAISEKLLIWLRKWQGLYKLVMKTVLSGRK